MSKKNKQPSPIDKMAGTVIKELRTKADKTQQDVAGGLGFAYQQLHKYETGTSRMSVGRFCEIVQQIGKDPAKALRQVLAGNGGTP